MTIGVGAFGSEICWMVALPGDVLNSTVTTQRTASDRLHAGQFLRAVLGVRRGGGGGYGHRIVVLLSVSYNRVELFGYHWDREDPKNQTDVTTDHFGPILDRQTC